MIQLPVSRQPAQPSDDESFGASGETRRFLLLSDTRMSGRRLVSSSRGLVGADEATHYGTDPVYRPARAGAEAHLGHVVEQRDPDGGVLYVAMAPLPPAGSRWHQVVFEAVDDLTMRPLGPGLRISEATLDVAALGKPSQHRTTVPASA